MPRENKIFKEFEIWYLSKKTHWEQMGVFVDEADLGQHGHQYWIKMHSENGLGNIVLYESNGYYWVDFESGNYSCDAMFLRTGIEFDEISELDTYEKAFIECII